MIELIILSIIEPGSLVVASVGSFCGTLAKKVCLRAVSKNKELVVTTAEGLDDSVEEDKYSPLIRFADGTVFTGSSKDIISSPRSLSSIPDFTCKHLLLAFSVWFTCVNCLTTDSGWMLRCYYLLLIFKVLVICYIIIVTCRNDPACNG